MDLNKIDSHYFERELYDLKIDNEDLAIHELPLEERARLAAIEIFIKKNKYEWAWDGLANKSDDISHAIFNYLINPSDDTKENLIDTISNTISDYREEDVQIAFDEIEIEDDFEEAA